MLQDRRTNRVIDILSTRAAAHLQNTLPILQKVADSTGPFPKSYHSLQPSLIPSCFYWIQWPKETQRPQANRQYGGFLLTNFSKLSFFLSHCKQTRKCWTWIQHVTLCPHVVLPVSPGPNPACTYWRSSTDFRFSGASLDAEAHRTHPPAPVASVCLPTVHMTSSERRLDRSAPTDSSTSLNGNT